MTLERRLSKLEASISPAVRPWKVMTVRCVVRRIEMPRLIATSRPTPKIRTRTS